MFDRRSLFALVLLILGALVFGCRGGTEEAPEEAPEVEESAEPPSAEPEETGEEASTDIPSDLPVVEMATSLGTMRIQLYPDEAPKTVENFLGYVREGFYDGTIFHRVVPGFVIQGGGFTPEMSQKETRPPIENEANNGLRNLRGTLCMARTSDPHSATSQFFINTKDNPPLDHRDPSPRGWGYAVFGEVIDGLDVVDAIENVPTTRKSGHSDVPVDPVVIERVRLVN